MATAEDARLILQLYEMRREEVMRKARGFMTGPEFLPTSAKEIMDMIWSDPQKSAWFRQASTYWDMAAALVNHGAIDEALFFDTNGEYLAIWSKIGEFVPELRESLGPQFLKNLEQLVAKQPNGAMRLQIMKERYKKMAEMRAAKPA